MVDYFKYWDQESICLILFYFEICFILSYFSSFFNEHEKGKLKNVNSIS